MLVVVMLVVMMLVVVMLVVVSVVVVSVVVAIVNLVSKLLLSYCLNLFQTADYYFSTLLSSHPMPLINDQNGNDNDGKDVNDDVYE